MVDDTAQDKITFDNDLASQSNLSPKRPALGIQEEERDVISNLNQIHSGNNST